MWRAEWHIHFCFSCRRKRRRRWWKTLNVAVWGGGGRPVRDLRDLRAGHPGGPGFLLAGIKVIGSCLSHSGVQTGSGEHISQRLHLYHQNCL